MSVGDRRLFFRAFVRALAVCLALWAAAAAVLLYVNGRWSRRDIDWSMARLRAGLVGYLASEEDRGWISRTLTLNGNMALEEHGGQVYLRAYDSARTLLGESQLLVAFAGPGDIHDTLFDAVMTEEEQLAAAHLLLEYPELLDLVSASNPERSFGGLEMTGWVEGKAFYPVRAALWLDGEEVVLVDRDPAEFPDRELQTVRNETVQFYSALAGPGGPERRLERFRAMEAEADELEGMMPGSTWPAPGAVVYLTGANAALDATGEPVLSSNYVLPPLYFLRGLGPALVLTLLLAAALAAAAAWLNTRTLLRERAFTRAAAHELKTPLAVLRAHAEALREDIDPAKRGEYLDVVLSEADRMAALTAGLLDLSRLEAGAEVKREPVNLTALVGAAFARLALPMERRGLAVTLDLDPCAVEGDRRLLELLAGELAANAARHAAPGGAVAVTLKQAGDRAELTVDNDGDNLPKADLERIWEPFYRPDKSRSRDTGGTGLGLALVKAAAEAHGGGCAAENRPGGVRFRVWLPCLQKAGSCGMISSQ